MVLTAYDIECLQKAKQIIENNTREHHHVSYIARTVGMSATKLKAGFKQYYGSGLFAFLTELRMKEARSLLEENKLAIKAISKAMGYKHVSNFSKAFKKKFGITPGTVRCS